MDINETRGFVEATWSQSIVPALAQYVTIPNQSPAFDRDWRHNGHMDRAVDLVASWIQAQGVPGLDLQVVRIEGRTPLVFVEVPGDSSTTVLLYGHLDKQPPMDGWHEGLGPRQPVIRDGRLYGRGAADDGYAGFAAITAIAALKRQGLPCARCVVAIEACEESGSFDLPPYVDVLKPRIGTPDLVVCLDSGCGNYEQLWLTTSLRGLVTANLSVSTLTQGVHSGGASGIVPSSFRVLRQLLGRLEDASSGEILVRALHVELPEERRQQAAASAKVLGTSLCDGYPFQAGTRPVTDDIEQLLLNRTWRPQLEIIGAAGLPAPHESGNVLRPVTTLKLSLRLPPTASAPTATALLKRLFEEDPPYGAQVRFECESGASGWNAPALAPWLAESAQRASLDFFGKEACYVGEGGTIPFMAMLGEKFPQAQFVITGVLGPHSNAHGPNEFLDLATGVKLTCSVSRLLVDHFHARCHA